jgi:hypothetical protein
MSLNCDCGNKITEDVTLCEWCEYPETPMYKATKLGNMTILCFLGLGDKGYELEHGVDLRVLAPSIESADLILQDYLAKRTGEQE